MECEKLSTSQRITDFLHSLQLSPEMKTFQTVELYKQFKESQFGTLSPEEINDMEKKTRGQGSNVNWTFMRKGAIGSSIYKRVCTRLTSLKKDKKEDPSKLLRTIMGETSINENRLPGGLAWGRACEPKARALYSLTIKKSHSNAKVQETGLFHSTDHPFLITSPDGIVRCKCHEPWLLEIKSPERFKDDTPLEAAKKYGCIMENGVLKLPSTHEHYYQIQGQLALTKHTRCTLVVFTNLGIHQIDVPYDAEFVHKMLANLEEFSAGYLFPHLVESVCSK